MTNGWRIQMFCGPCFSFSPRRESEKILSEWLSVLPQRRATVLTSPVNTNYTLAMLKGLTREHFMSTSTLVLVLSQVRWWVSHKGQCSTRAIQVIWGGRWPTGICVSIYKTLRYECTFYGMKHTESCCYVLLVTAVTKASLQPNIGVLVKCASMDFLVDI